MNEGLDRLLDSLRERGLALAVGHDGTPRLSGPRAEITEQLLAWLGRHRAEIVERLRPPPAREWLWPCRAMKPTHLYRETPADEFLWGQPDRHPCGAWWWRWAGEAGWRLVPGREARPLPDGERMFEVPA